MKPSLAIYGVDLSAESLEIGRQQFAGQGVLVETLEQWEAARQRGEPVVMLAQGSADEVAFEDGRFDLAVMGNAIHLMPDKPKFLAEVHRLLRPGGSFAFNSVFFTGTFGEGTEAVYTEWLKQALLVLNEKNEARRQAGLPPIPRVRGKAGRAFDKGWMRPDQWSALLEAAGFRIVSVSRRPVAISQKGLEMVGAYGGLAEVLMSGYPVEVASECLQEGVGRAFSVMGVSEVIRYWLEVVVEKP